MEQENRLSVYDSMPAMKAVAKNALPAIVAMVMVLVYNLSDMLFIGLTHNDLQVAAVQLATPVFLVFMSLGTIFGIGGASVISRALGAGRVEYAKKVSAFCTWLSAAVGIVVSALFLIFMDDLLVIIGTKAETYEYTKGFLTIVTFGGTLMLMSECFANIIRAEGQPTKSMRGMIVGNLITIILDPIMIFLFGLGVRGAAIATVIGNVGAMVCYLVWLMRGKSILSVSLRHFKVTDKIASGVLLIGIPAALGSMLMSFSQIVMNGLMSAYGSLPIAAAGVASKITMIIGMVAIGLGQGTQPLLGYAVGSKNRKRYKEIMRASVSFALVLCLVLTVLTFIFTRGIVDVFLTGTEALDDGIKFARILLSTTFLFGIFYCMTSAMQAIGAAIPALIVNISRQGLIYIPALFIMNKLLGMQGLIWAQPIADVLSLVLAITLQTTAYRKFTKSMDAEDRLAEAKILEV